MTIITKTQNLHCLLLERGLTISVAESCTGGLLAHKLCREPGASAFFYGAIVAYVDSAKANVLGIPTALLQQEGAVSETVAMAMAQQVKIRFGTQIGLSTTGYSGPAGGSDKYPVGTAFVGLALAEKILVRKFYAKNLSRTEHQEQTAAFALQWLESHM